MAMNLANWFVENRTLVLFVYGLVFFILGISISLQSRHYSRLNLAKSLPWLAAFGILHGLYEWGDIFIPIQLGHLGSPFISILDFIHHIDLALSFLALFQFGIELMRPFPPKWKWLRAVPTAVLLIWAIGPFGLGFIFSTDINNWHGFANAMTRYMLCIPGCIISAIGLFRQVRQQIDPMKLPHIGRTLKVAAGAILAYGVFAGVIVPKALIFPASVINVDTFTKIFIAPPPVFRSIAGFVLLIAMISALEVFNIETDHLIRMMEERQVISNEREHIARDLHDGALQQVYAAGLLAQSLKNHLKGEKKEEVNQLILTINQAIERLRSFLPQTQAEIASVDLAAALFPVIEEARRNISIDTLWDSLELPSLSPDQTRHLTAFVSEALSNVIRHAKSDKVEVRLFLLETHLMLQVRDFGKGISPSADPGFGLRSMRDRARLLGATLKFDTEQGKGTTVTLDLPMENKE
jgi:signal transduction histidine kinase